MKILTIIAVLSLAGCATPYQNPYLPGGEYGYQGEPSAEQSAQNRAVAECRYEAFKATNAGNSSLYSGSWSGGAGGAALGNMVGDAIASSTRQNQIMSLCLQAKGIK